MPDVVALRPGDPGRIDRYRLTGRLDGYPPAGQPAADGVFLATTDDGDDVVLTVLDGDVAASPAARERFTAQARAAHRIAPFCVARILNSGFTSTGPYLVSEFVPGPSLGDVVERQGPLPPEPLAALAIGTASGLAAIHQAGLAHGRFGPGHVLLGPAGPKVAGFSMAGGTAPPAADLLAWAKTILFAAAGRPAIGPQDLAALPDRLTSTVARCLNPVAAGRPTARAVLATLLGGDRPPAGLLAEGAKQARAAAWTPPSSGPERQEPALRRPRARALVWAGACGACVLAIGVAAVAIVTRAPGPAPSAASAGHSPGPSSSASVPPVLAGHWSGQVRQQHPVLRVSVRISLPAGSPAGTVTYPQLGCSGTLAVVSFTGGRLTVTQAIETGRKDCADGVITLTRQPGGTLAFTFGSAGRSRPHGTLSRHG